MKKQSFVEDFNIAQKNNISEHFLSSTFELMLIPFQMSNYARSCMTYSSKCYRDVYINRLPSEVLLSVL